MSVFYAGFYFLDVEIRHMLKAVIFDLDKSFFARRAKNLGKQTTFGIPE